MNSRLYIFGGLALTLLVGLACEKIIGIEAKHRLVQTDAGSSGTCRALSTNGTGLRVANMVPGEQRVDVCIAPTGVGYPEQPLFASSGSDCPAGVGYGQYTVRLAVPVGTYDVKLVSQGSSCSADGPTITGVPIEAPTDTANTSSTTLVATGNNWSAPEVRLTFLKDADSTGANIYVRLFHALLGAGNLDAGFVDPNKTPPAISTVIFGDVPFGSVSPPSEAGKFPVNHEGYMIYPVQGNDVGGLNLGAGLTGSVTHETLVKSFVTLTREHHYTLFATGDVEQPSLPPRLWSCDETSSYGAFAECGEPRPVSIGIFHPNLTDIFTDYIDLREDAALSAIANPDAANGATANLLCIPELFSPSTRGKLKDLLRNTATLVLSDAYTPSPESDLTDQTGALPQYKDVVCDGDLQAQLQSLESCFLDPQLQAQGCIAAVDEDGGVGKHYFALKGKQAIGCAAEACQAQVGNFVLAGSFDANACFMCAIAHLSSGEAVEDMYSACTSSNQGKQHYVYGGSTGLGLVIKPPLTLAPGDEPEVITLPASTWNRAALRVPVKLPNNAVVDVWCANVRAPNSETFMPNGGPYHGDATAEVVDIERANAAEEALQISRLVAAVNRHASTVQRRALIAALTYASPQIGEQVVALHPENYALFENTGWQELVARSYAPACTFCGDNPLNFPQDRQWMEHIFGIGIEPDMVTDTQRTFMAKLLKVVLYSTMDGTPTDAPVSQYYGIQSTVRISQ